MTKLKGAKNWTAAELDYLSDKWGTVSIKGIAAHLGRSLEAVKLKAQRTGFGDARLSGDGITLNQLAKALNRQYSSLKYWYLEKELPARKKVFCKAKVLFISYPDFWKWAELHKTLMNFTEFKEHDLGPEPKWVKVKRRADLDRANRSSIYTDWSELEDKKLLSLVNVQRYTYSEISKMLNRNSAAVKRRLYDLGSKARPVRMKSSRWTPEQLTLLVEMAEQGHGYSTIGDKIGKSELGVRGKLERMKFNFQTRKLPRIGETG